MGEKSIERLTIKGFKSIKNLDGFPLRDLNVLIGPNGSGKSNFISYFRMMGELLNGRLHYWATKQGSADRIASFGVMETNSIESTIDFPFGSYKFRLEATMEGDFFFVEEKATSTKSSLGHVFLFGAASSPRDRESMLKKSMNRKKDKPIVQPICDAISGWRVYHFHDTGDMALVKRIGVLQDNEYLRPDASNLAAFLYRLSRVNPDIYRHICDVVRLAIPFFDDFVLKPDELDNGDCQIRLFWRQRESDYVLSPNQFSDGAISFICLATALLQPNPPSTVIIDEPELGLHPYAITLLASLLQLAATRMQVIVSTQSVDLVNEFSIGDLVIVEREDNVTVFKREEECNFEKWLDEYSVGELWGKNILGGGLPK
jgi:predicted ATPase